ncbi:hypothetical protein LB505_011421 [Fusarium chuoi]|nr:hypothetical protein LB505_011421 [Fusarium chuoi]
MVKQKSYIAVQGIRSPWPLTATRNRFQYRTLIADKRWPPTLTTGDVKNLSLTSKHLHSATLETVWKSIVIPAWNKRGIFGIKLAGLPLDRLLLARHIDLRFIDEAYSRICLHSQKLQLCREAADESIIARPAAFSSVEEITISILEECEKNHWESFRFMNHLPE